MSREYTSSRRLALNTLTRLKYEVFDLFGATDFQIANGNGWSLYGSGSGTSVLSGTLNQNNSDTNEAGSTIKTVTANIDLTVTDTPSTGPYYLILTIALTNGQSDKFRVPVWVSDFETKGMR